jgi:hypothetical protein
MLINQQRTFVHQQSTMNMYQSTINSVIMTVSWQDASIAGGAILVSRGCSDPVFIMMIIRVFFVHGLGSPIPSPGLTSVDYLISYVRSSCGIRVYLIADGDFSGISSVVGDLSSGISSSILELSSYSLAARLHTLGFYAVSVFLFISDGFDVTSMFIPDAAPTLPKSPTLSAGPVASPSREPSPSAYPSAVPLWTDSYSSILYDVYWSNQSQNSASWGYHTTFHMGVWRVQ